jgi:PKHD-type hydroxylase
MKQLLYDKAQPGVCIETKLPSELVGMMNDYLSRFSLYEGAVVDKYTPNNRNSYVSFTQEMDWISAFVWYYVSQANEYNFKYDIETVDSSRVQYTVYEEGMFYGWHCDENISGNSSIQHPGVLTHAVPLKEYSRKLSFSLQLSDESEYTGGDLQILGNRKLITMPKEIGSIIIFDSRLTHRVTKVKSGVRKSLVGWVLGPRWR